MEQFFVMMDAGEQPRPMLLSSDGQQRLLTRSIALLHSVAQPCHQILLRGGRLGLREGHICLRLMHLGKYLAPTVGTEQCSNNACCHE